MYRQYSNNNDNTANGIRFKFSYSDGSYGYLDENGDFVGFSSGGIDTSDATAYPYHVTSGKTFYARGEKLTGTRSKIMLHTTAPDLSVARQDLAAISIGDYALFAGGKGPSSMFDNVDTYTLSLTKGTASNLSVARTELKATSIGNYALFGGGHGSGYQYDVVDTYNTSLTKGIATALTQVKTQFAATSIGNYALFAGGQGIEKNIKTVDTYNLSLTKGTASNLSTGRKALSGACNNNYAIFAGGQTVSGSMGTQSNVVDAYNKSSLSRSTPQTLLYATSYLAATSMGNWAIFGGGMSNPSYVTTYNDSLSLNNIAELSAARYHLAAAYVADHFGMFGGGYHPSNSPFRYSIVDTYNASSLTHSTFTALSLSRSELAATSIQNKVAIFAGGYSINNEYSNVVDAYLED